MAYHLSLIAGKTNVDCNSSAGVSLAGVRHLTFHRPTLSRNRVFTHTLITDRVGFAFSSSLGWLLAAGAYLMVLGNSQPVQILVWTCHCSSSSLQLPWLIRQPQFC